MIEGPDWLFVENPKTGSSAMSRALRYMGGEVTKTKHMTLMDSQTAAGKKHKFCFVRNPWDRMVSAWAYTAKGKDLSFEDWLTGDRWDAGIGFDIKRCPQICWAFRCSNVFLFENIQEEWRRVCEGIVGQPYQPLVRSNPSDHPPYREVVGPRARDIIADRFKPDIEAFGYEF